MGGGSSKKVDKKTLDDGPLSKSDIDQRITGSTASETFQLGKENVSFRYAVVSQRGYYPDAPNKENQDSFMIKTQFSGQDQQAFFGVFDGHGSCGEKCARFAAEELPDQLARKLKSSKNLEEAFLTSFVETNTLMHKQAFDDKMSGTTAITVLIDGLKFYVANVGDSRAIIAQEENGRLVGYPLSIDQTPFRYDERERVKKCGAKVMTMDQMEGIEPMHESWGLSLGEELDTDGDPPRIWKPGTRGPGTAFTRSLGDGVAEELGVFAEPELLSKPITCHDRFIVLASDGVFEFLTNQAVVEIVSRFEDPLQACKAVVAEAYRLWLQYEVRTDDITMICIFVEGNEDIKTEEQRVPDASSDLSTTAAGINSSAGQILNQELRPVRRNVSRAMRTQIVASQAEIKEEKYIVADHVVYKTEEEMARIAKAVKANFLFSHLNESQRSDIFSVMQKQVVKAGEVVIRQGDEGDKFYIVDEGKFEVWLATPDSTFAKPGNGQLVHTYNSNGGTHPCFGELALMYGKPRAASVIASQDGMLWALDRMVFRQILMKTATPVLVKKLRQVEVLKSLDVKQLQRLADILTEVTFEDGEYIIRQGDEGETFYVLTSGAASCTVKVEDAFNERKSKRQTLKVKEVMRLKEGDYFGERALLNNEPRAANVVAVGPTKCLYIGRLAFEEVLGPLQDIIDEDRKRREETEMKKQRRRKMTVFQQDLQQCTSLETTRMADLEFLRCIRSGKMGDISLYVHKKDTNVYTLKTFSKRRVLDSKQERSVMKEKDLFQFLLEEPTPFVPMLIATMVDTSCLHIFFKVKICSEFHTLMEAEPFTEAVAQFYGASMVLIIEDLHQESIVHRSMAPELLAVDELGYLCVVDLRYAKKLNDDDEQRTFTVCGTPEYMPPEQVSATGHGLSADLWSLGVFLYELVAGATPFGSEGIGNETDIYKRILSYQKGSSNHLSDSNTSEELKNLVDSLIVVNEVDRLNGTRLRDHPWFEKTNWEDLRNHKVEAPHKTAVTGFATIAEGQQPTYDDFNGDESVFEGF